MQNTDFPYEIHIHDDASSDATPEIIQDYQKKYPNLIKPIFQKRNQYSIGTNPLNNYIYPKLNGDYVAYCEGDDYWTDPLKLQKQVDFMDTHPEYVLCAHDVHMKYEKGVAEKKVFYNKPAEGDFSFTFLDEFLSHFVATVSIFLRREAVVSIPNTTNLVSLDIFILLYLL